MRARLLPLSKHTTIPTESGKRLGGTPNVSSAAPQSDSTGDLLYVHDEKTGRRWLIDGGALISILPPTEAQKLFGPN